MRATSARGAAAARRDAPRVYLVSLLLDLVYLVPLLLDLVYLLSLLLDLGVRGVPLHSERGLGWGPTPPSGAVGLSPARHWGLGCLTHARRPTRAPFTAAPTAALWRV